MERNTCMLPARLDVFLADADDTLSRNAAQRLIRQRAVLVNEVVCDKPNHMLKAGDSVGWELPAPEPMNAIPEQIPLDILYEDETLCVINKPQGMVVHPAPGHSNGTLVNGLLYHFSDLPVIGGVFRPGIVHRIDKMTSGLLVVARTDFAQRTLSEQFRTHVAQRSYLAIVDDNLRENSGTVDARIGRHPTDRKRMAVTQNGREAVTHWSVLNRFGSNTLIAVRLETGRTHQIRVHMASVHHPITGDTTYGKAKNGLGLEGQALHGYRLSLIHPLTGARLCVYAPPPDQFLSALIKLGLNEPSAQLMQRADELLFGKDDSL